MIDPEDPVASLRARAEARLRRGIDPHEEGAADHARVVHELEVHESELRIQNEELRRAKIELEEAHDRYFALFDRAPVGFVTVDERGVVRAANRAAGLALGAPARSLVGSPLSGRFSPAAVASLSHHVNALFRASDNDTLEIEVARPDGESGPGILRLQSRLHVSSGGREGWIALTDVTAMREAESALGAERDFAERLLDVAPVFALVLDPEGRVIRMNRRLEEASGFALAEVRGADWFETFLPTRIRAETSEVFAGALKGVRTRGHVNPIKTRSGEERLVEWHDTPVFASDGTLAGILAIGRDITEATRLEEEARHAQKMEAVGTLAAGVAHDFNNLLMGMAGVLEIAIRKTPSDSEVAPLLKMVLERAQAGTATVSQLMAFSRRSRAEPVEQVLDASLEEVTRMLGVTLGEDISLTVELGAGGARVCLGRGQIEQIVTNLCLNARQAMPSGGRLSVRSRLDDGAERRVCLQVEDTGVGMDDATRRRVFEPFFTTKREGTGLGLSMVYGIIEQAGGSVDVTSTPGEGTLFHIHLPSVRDSQVGIPAPPTVRRAGAGETILMVEDEAVVRLTLRQYLEDGGYRVLEAEDAARAIDIFDQHCQEIDLLLCDVVLRGVQGPQLVERLRALVPELRVILMSAHPSELLREQGALDGVSTFLQKPFGETDLLAVLGASFDRVGE